MAGRGDIEAMIAAAVAGRALPQIAAAGGVSVSTVQRRLREPEVAEAILQARVLQRQERLGQLNDLSARAVTRLGELINAEHPVVALRAIGLLLTTVIKLDPIVELDERLACVEAAAGDNQSSDDDE
jgi:flavin-dependent dehydrogenase